MVNSPVVIGKKKNHKTENSHRDNERRTWRGGWWQDMINSIALPVSSETVTGVAENNLHY